MHPFTHVVHSVHSIWLLQYFIFVLLKTSLAAQVVNNCTCCFLFSVADGLFGLRNLGNSCYMNATVQLILNYGTHHVESCVSDILELSRCSLSKAKMMYIML